MSWKATYYLDALYRKGEHAITREEESRTRSKGAHHADELLGCLDSTTEVLHDILWDFMAEGVPLKVLPRLNYVGDLYGRNLQRGVRAVRLSVKKGKGDKCKRFVRAVDKHCQYKLKRSVTVFDRVTDFVEQRDHLGLEIYLSRLEHDIAPRRSSRISNQRRRQESRQATDAMRVS